MDLVCFVVLFPGQVRQCMRERISNQIFKLLKGAIHVEAACWIHSETFLCVKRNLFVFSSHGEVATVLSKQGPGSNT